MSKQVLPKWRILKCEKCGKGVQKRNSDSMYFHMKNCKGKSQPRFRILPRDTQSMKRF